ncbi:MAG: TRAP transporter fused permease subunit [Candidatus Aminicenantes bacterium]
MAIRKLSGVPAKIVSFFCITVSLLVFYTAFRGAFPPLVQRAGFLMFMVPLILVLYPRSKKTPADKIPVSDLLQAILAFASYGWIIVDYGRISSRMKYVDPVTLTDLVLGTLATLFILEATRRTLGWVLVIITSVFIAYTFIGPYLTGILSFKTISYSLFIEQFYLVPEGLFNIMTGLAATFLFTFVAFGTFLRFSGADRYYTDLCLAVAGKSSGGTAKVAVFSAALMGTLTGSTISNVVTVGTLTIPMMKKSGFKAREAAAITTAASTGGAVTPPIMGAGVFVMAAITGIPLLTILKYSIVPAIIYFASIYLIIEIKAKKYGLKGLSEHEIPSLKKAVKTSFHLFIPLIVLVVLLVMGRTPFVSSAATTVLIVICSLFRKETRMGPKKILNSLEASAKNMMVITAVSACAAAIMGVITLTGLIMKVTSIIIVLSQNQVLIALALLGVISLIIGMGMPITLSYILVSTLGAPALTQLGVSLLAAHLAIFWFSQNSTITPPVCMTAFVAAEIAQEPRFMRVGFSTLNIAKMLYLIPFLFVFTPLVKENTWGPIQVLVQVLPLLVMVAVLTDGFFLARLKKWEWIISSLSVLFFGAAIFVESLVLMLAFSVMGLITALMLFYSQKKRSQPEIAHR